MARIATMGELTASIAHEINQPLTAVVNNGNFALRQVASGAPNLEELREAIAEIVNDGTRASDVISRIRALLQKGAPDRVELDINEVIRGSHAFLCAMRRPKAVFPYGSTLPLICHACSAIGCNCSRS